VCVRVCVCVCVRARTRARAFNSMISETSKHGSPGHSLFAVPEMRNKKRHFLLSFSFYRENFNATMEFLLELI